ncbi:MAG: hypothetical protein JKX97_06135 [Candidatus Lindowbacteria bacterium]|nr:hypothetical protein [Candidatus Lindowbacteria bacterium]
MEYQTNIFDQHEMSAVFRDALNKLELEQDQSPTLESIVETLIKEAGNFGSVRIGEDEPAIRLLALDGAITAHLGKGLVSADVSSESLVLLCGKLCDKSEAQ